ncbi:hypothetical protein EPN28_03320 [Patescibacteria group bacterium]|nr:MAG: hypothetical protein EPN28_03320 [Patescibacteria group bacterium]
MHVKSDKILPQLRNYAWKIIESDLSKLSNEELARIYEQLLPLQTELHLYRVPSWLLEIPFEQLGIYLLNYLKKFNPDIDAVLVLADLLTLTKPALGTQEHLELYELAKEVVEGKIQLSVGEEKIAAHARKYCFLPFACEGPTWTEKDVVKHIQEIIEAGTDIEQEILRQKNQFFEAEKKQNAWFDNLKIDEKHKHLFRVTKDLVYQKAWSKEHQFLGFYALDKILREVAKRLLISIRQARYFLPQEVPSAIRSGQCDADELNERWKYSLLYVDANGSKFIVGEEARYVMSKMNMAREEEVDLSVQELRGQTAVPGAAKGKVTIVNTIEDMKKMVSGNVLVSEMTIPEIVAAMKKASAIVTDMGGIVCHAAIVSRELGIPCVIGTKIATKVFRDGDMVEVDATKGIVKKI